MNRFSMRRLGWMAVLAALAIVGGPGVAQAHVGVGPVHDLVHGLQHPVSGLDHLCAMLAVGIWAAQLGGRASWAVPLSFISVMMLGGAIAIYGLQLPLVEPGVVMSLVVLGLLIATATRLPLVMSAAVIGSFALVHGYAHGAEVPAESSVITYAIGFILMTAALHAVGIAFGLLTKRLSTPQLQKLAGATIAACGLYLIVG
jgi:urease accessory protein